MNCLQYALRFWIDNKDYDIYYDHEHVINLKRGLIVENFFTLEAYGFNHILSSFRNTLSQNEIKILQYYFETKETGNLLTQ